MPRKRKTDKGRLKEKRGTGRGELYKPWLKVREVPSEGRCHKILGIKHNRIHHLMSDLEYYFFLLLSFDNKVFEIREQYPLLPLQYTQKIARELGKKHPNVEGDDIVLSTDFLITIRKGIVYEDIVRTVKASNKINHRALEKFEIEREFFRRLYNNQKFDWAVVTEKDMDIIKAKNLSNLKNSYNWPQLKKIDSYSLNRMIDTFKNSLIENNYETYSSLIYLKEQYNLNNSDSVDFIKFLIIKEHVNLNLSEKLIKDYRKVKLKL